MFDGVTLERDAPVRMRDGTVLRADVYRPEHAGEYPVLLQRNPYDKTIAQTIAFQHPAWYARHGYVVVVQDSRGRFASDGVFEPYRHEALDGADTVHWAAGLHGSNGSVGHRGSSAIWR
jgi:putative CocE/NonD family hydrolase